MGGTDPSITNIYSLVSPFCPQEAGQRPDPAPGSGDAQYRYQPAAGQQGSPDTGI